MLLSIEEDCVDGAAAQRLRAAHYWGSSAFAEALTKADPLLRGRHWLHFLLPLNKLLCQWGTLASPTAKSKLDLSLIRNCKSHQVVVLILLWVSHHFQHFQGHTRCTTNPFAHCVLCGILKFEKVERPLSVLHVTCMENTLERWALHFCREVWSDSDQFGASDMSPEEEFMAMREIFFANLPRELMQFFLIFCLFIYFCYILFTLSSSLCICCTPFPHVLFRCCCLSHTVMWS